MALFLLVNIFNVASENTGPIGVAPYLTLPGSVAKLFLPGEGNLSLPASTRLLNCVLDLGKPRPNNQPLISL